MKNGGSWMTQTLSAPNQVELPAFTWQRSLSLASPGLSECDWPGLEWRSDSERAVNSLLGRRHFRVESHVRDIAMALMAGLWSACGDSPHRLLPQAFQLPNGGLQLEWHAADNHVEVSIEASGVVGLYVESAGHSTDVEVIPSRSPIPRVVIEAHSRITEAAWRAHSAR